MEFTTDPLAQTLADIESLYPQYYGEATAQQLGVSGPSPTQNVEYQAAQPSGFCMMGQTAAVAAAAPVSVPQPQVMIARAVQSEMMGRKRPAEKRAAPTKKAKIDGDESGC